MSSPEPESDSPQPRPGSRVTHEDKNTVSFRVAHSTSTPTRSAVPPPTSPQREAQPTQHQLYVRLRSLIVDVERYIDAHPHDDAAADNFQELAEEAVRSVRAAKLGARDARRRLAHHVDAQALELPGKAVSPEVAAASAGKSPSKPRSYAAVAMKARSTSRPRTGTDKADELTRRTQDSRAAALRSEDKRQEAEGRRRIMQHELQSKHEKVAERAAETKARREETATRTAAETQQRAERAAQLRQAEMGRRKEFPKQDAVRQGEVNLMNELRESSRALCAEDRQRQQQEQQEQRRLEAAQSTQAKADAYDAVLDRHRDMEQQRQQQQREKDQRREEQLRRLEEQRRAEEGRQRERVEERERRVQDQREKALVEQEARALRAAEKAEQSERAREERERRQREKLERQEQKQRDARERRDKEGRERPPTIRSDAEEEAAHARLQKTLGAITKKARAFVEQRERAAEEAREASPAKEPAKELRQSVAESRARQQWRVIIARLQASQGTAQARAPLQDLLAGLAAAAPADHEAVRATGALTTLVDLVTECRKATAARTPDATTARLVWDLLHRLFVSQEHSAAHIEFAVRSGCVVPIAVAVYDELHKRRGVGAGSRSALSLLHLLVAHTLLSPALGGFRPLLIELVDTVGVPAFIDASVPALHETADVLSLHFALLMQHAVVQATAASAPQEGALQRMVHVLLSLATQILLPKGAARRREDGPVRPMDTLLLFSVFRILAHVTRLQLQFIQALLSPPDRTTELYHVIAGMCVCVATSDELMEDIPGRSAVDIAAVIGEASGKCSDSFIDAVRFGLCPAAPPRADHAAEPEAQRPVLRAALHEMLLFAGYLAVNNPAVQDLFAYGHDRPLLADLVESLPFAYFGLAKHTAFPLLIAVCHRHERNCDLLSQEMDVEALRDFLRDEFDNLPPKARKKVLEAHAQLRTPKVAPGPSQSWADMLDDDDSDPFADLSAAAEQRSLDSARQEAEKHKVAKSLGDHSRHASKQAVPYELFFRLDKRFAIDLWPSALESLGGEPLTPLQPPAPAPQPPAA